jgi:hypothetical protein
MPAAPSARVQEIARHWHDLAERRLAYYNELYRSGRWKHYYRSQEQFAVRMIEVIKAARTFAKVADEAGAPAADRNDDLRPAA